MASPDRWRENFSVKKLRPECREEGRKTFALDRAKGEHPRAYPGLTSISPVPSGAILAPSASTNCHFPGLRLKNDRVCVAMLADIAMEISLSGKIIKNILQELGIPGKEDALPALMLVTAKVGNL